jgi:hypothetical protein
MLCPECQRSAAGGSLCPQCGQAVPESESFEGQGDRYLRVLSATSVVLFIGFAVISSQGADVLTRLNYLWEAGRLWLPLVLCLAPAGAGFYYWALLREEEITLTDEYIARRSHWGDEHLAWKDVAAFRREPVLFRETRLGAVARLGRLFRKNKLLWDHAPILYELIGPTDAQGEPIVMRLEPGTIDDMPWLLQLIEERIGPAQEH